MSGGCPHEGGGPVATARGSFADSLPGTDNSPWGPPVSGVPVIGGLTALLEGQDRGNVSLWRVVEVGGKPKEKGTSLSNQDDGAGRAPRTEGLNPVVLDQVFADMV
jgi:hypothetical protein